jgi:hypothetical protein
MYSPSTEPPAIVGKRPQPLTQSGITGRQEIIQRRHSHAHDKTPRSGSLAQ